MSEYSAHEPMQQHLRSRLTRTVEALRKNRFDACWVATKEEALEEVRATLREGAVVASGGSMTLAECGILSLLRSGAYQYLDREAVPREEIPALYRKAFSADFYLMSSNAVTENGELYNVDGNGNRVAALIYGPERVIVRVPLIPRFNTPEDQARSAEALRAMGVTRLDLFDYVIR